MQQERARPKINEFQESRSTLESCGGGGGGVGFDKDHGRVKGGEGGGFKRKQHRRKKVADFPSARPLALMTSAGNNSRSSDIVRPNFENVRPTSHYDRTR